jgi:rSAM/selenodomain-associated transferase 1
MREARHLVVFLRAPRLGRVKSRLAADIGALPALRFYRETSADLLRRVARDRRWRCRVALTPDRGADGRWLGGVERQPQGEGDLGRRMARAFANLPPGPAVIIGSDIPAITAGHVWAAFRALGHSDAVFGPAADGGYWLVGLRRRRLPLGLFAGVRWSSPHALADTLRSLPRGFRISTLETLEDIDEGESYRRWRVRNER